MASTPARPPPFQMTFRGYRLQFFNAPARWTLSHLSKKLTSSHMDMIPHLVPSWIGSSRKFNTCIDYRLPYKLAITSISTNELPGIPPYAAIVVRTGGSSPKRPRKTSFIAL